MTLKELRNKIERINEGAYTTAGSIVGTGTIEAIRTAEAIATYRDGSLSITVYSDGTVKARRGRRGTSFKITGCGAYTYHYSRAAGGAGSAEVAAETLDADQFEDLAWEIRVVMEAEDRLAKDDDLREFRNAARY